MNENSKLWINQNRFWLTNMAAVALLSITLLSLLTTVVPATFTELYLTVASDRPTLDEVANELTIEQMHQNELRSQLDSLASHENLQRTYEAILSAIRKRCDRRQVSLIGYDRIQQSRPQSDQIACYRLVVGGRFSSLALLLADLEVLPQNLTIQSMTLEQGPQSSASIRGVLLVSTGVP